MFKTLNRFAPLVGLVAISIVAFLAWRRNLGLYQSIRESISESWKDFVEMAKTAGAPLVCIG